MDSYHGGHLENLVLTSLKLLKHKITCGAFVGLGNGTLWLLGHMTKIAAMPIYVVKTL